MARFIENEANPIVSTLLRNGLIPTEAEALNLIDQSEERLKGDSNLALVGALAGVASSCGILALSGATAPILIPMGVVLGCGMTAWNSRQSEIDRVRESEFLTEHPEILSLIDRVDSAGMPQHRIAAAYEQSFKAYRYGDLDRPDRYLSHEPTPQTTLQDIPHDETPLPVPAVNPWQALATATAPTPLHQT
jgi:hypothetical protein